MANVLPLWSHFGRRYSGLSALIALSTVSTLLVAFLFPVFLGVVAKHGAKPWVITWFFAGVLWMTATTFASVHAEVDLRVQSTRYVNSMMLRYAYLHHDYSLGASNPSMKDMQSVRSAFAGLTKLAAHTYIPFLIGNFGSAVYVLTQDTLAGVWFGLIYAWTVAFPFTAQICDHEAKRHFAAAERALFEGTQLVLNQNGSRRTFSNESAPERYLDTLQAGVSESARKVTLQLMQQSGVYLLGLALLSLGLLRSLQRTKLSNSTRVTVLSMFVFNLKQVGKYLEDTGELTKYVSELQRALPEQYEVALRTGSCGGLTRTRRELSERNAQEPLLTVQNLQYYYNGCRSVFSKGPLSFECYPGERVAVLGGNGSGKSTLLQLVAHRLDTLGAVRVCGHVFENELDAAPYVSYYVQNQLGWELWSVEDNLNFAVDAAEPTDVRGTLRSWGVEWVFEEFERGYQTLLCELSLGQRQFIAVIQVLLKGAPVVLLDEPTAAMNSRYSNVLAEVLRTHLDFQRVALMFVTHDAAFCKALATRTIDLSI